MSTCFKITVAYDGTDYVGWQIQPNGATIQAELQRAIEAVTGESVSVTGSGRTDAGVHARGQVASFRLKDWQHGPIALMRAMNVQLDDSIVVLDGAEVSRDFHPIGDSIRKRYRYQLQLHGPADPHSERYRWRMKGQPMEERTFDEGVLKDTALRFVGTHDFAGFEASGAPRPSTIRTVEASEFRFYDDETGRRRFADFDITADGFLYNMVRNIVGTLVEVGRGRRSVDSIEEIFAAADRSLAGVTAPPHGLFLMQVDYPS